MIRKLAGLALAGALISGGPAFASPVMNFTLDDELSTARINKVSRSFCSLGFSGWCYDLRIVEDFNGMSSFALTPGASSQVFDFVSFTYQGNHSGLYDIHATLAITQPVSTTIQSDGDIEVVNSENRSVGMLSVAGSFRSGRLTWDQQAPQLVRLWDGSAFEVEFLDFRSASLDGTLMGQARISAVDFATAPLPVPGLLLAAGIGALAVLRRRKERAAA